MAGFVCVFCCLRMILLCLKFLLCIFYFLPLHLTLSLCSMVPFTIHCVLCDRLLEYVLSQSKAKVVFVATDKNPMINDIEERFEKKKVAVLFY